MIRNPFNCFKTYMLPGILPVVLGTQQLDFGTLIQKHLIILVVVSFPPLYFFFLSSKSEKIFPKLPSNVSRYPLIHQ